MEQKLRELLLAHKFEEAADLVVKESPETLAALLNNLAVFDKGLLTAFCRVLESDLLADVLVTLKADVQEKILSGLHDDELEAVMDEVSADDTMEIIEEIWPSSPLSAGPRKRLE